MKKNLFLFSMCLLALWACEKVVQPSSEPGSSVIEGTEQQKTWGYANVFAKNTMNLYYLWQKEIASSLDSWKSTEDPSETMLARALRASGKNPPSAQGKGLPHPPARTDARDLATRENC